MGVGELYIFGVPSSRVPAAPSSGDRVPGTPYLIIDLCRIGEFLVQLPFTELCLIIRKLIDNTHKEM